MSFDFLDVLLDAETNAEVTNVSFKLNQTSNDTTGINMELPVYSHKWIKYNQSRLTIMLHI